MSVDPLKKQRIKNKTNSPLYFFLREPPTSPPISPTAAREEGEQPLLQKRLAAPAEVFETAKQKRLLQRQELICLKSMSCRGFGQKKLE